MTKNEALKYLETFMGMRKWFILEIENELMPPDMIKQMKVVWVNIGLLKTKAQKIIREINAKRIK